MTVNALEYASLIINCLAVTYVLVHVDPSRADPHPVILFYADNTIVELWTKKADTSS